MTGRIFAFIAFLLGLSLVYSAHLICNTNQIVEDPPSINQGGDATPRCIFFTEPNYNGDQAGIRPGEAILHDLDPKWKKSIMISPHHELILFEKEEFGGDLVVLDKSIPDLVGRFNGSLPKSFWYRPTTTDPSIFPRIYVRTSFGGDMLVIRFGLTELPEPKIFGSMKIPVGFRVKLTTVYGPGPFLKKDIVFTSDSDELPFTDPVTSVFVSFGPVK
jgi:hypothetical protein